MLTTVHYHGSSRRKPKSEGKMFFNHKRRKKLKDKNKKGPGKQNADLGSCKMGLKRVTYKWQVYTVRIQGLVHTNLCGSSHNIPGLDSILLCWAGTQLDAIVSLCIVSQDLLSFMEESFDQRLSHCRLKFIQTHLLVELLVQMLLQKYYKRIGLLRYLSFFPCSLQWWIGLIWASAQMGYKRTLFCHSCCPDTNNDVSWRVLGSLSYNPSLISHNSEHISVTEQSLFPAM